jgi:casein kinase II subunit alpha
MESMAGGTSLAEIIANRYEEGGDDLRFEPFFTEKEVQNIIYMLLVAFKHFHKKGLYHRDIKPDNILIDSRSKKLKIIDFGLSRNVNDKYEDNNIIAGTLNFIAPEVYESKG